MSGLKATEGKALLKQTSNWRDWERNKSMFSFSILHTFHFLPYGSLIYHLEHIWLSQLWSYQCLFFTLSVTYMATQDTIKEKTICIISRELCKRSLSFHNLETTGNPLTLYLSTVLLWSSSTERGLLNNSCWGFTQQLCSITVLGMIQGGTECISSTHTQARRQMNISQRPEGRSFMDLQKPLPKVAHIKMFFPMGKVCLWLERC